MISANYLPVVVTFVNNIQNYGEENTIPAAKIDILILLVIINTVSASTDRVTHIWPDK